MDGVYDHDRSGVADYGYDETGYADDRHDPRYGYAYAEEAGYEHQPGYVYADEAGYTDQAGYQDRAGYATEASYAEEAGYAGAEAYGHGTAYDHEYGYDEESSPAGGDYGAEPYLRRGGSGGARRRAAHSGGRHGGGTHRGPRPVRTARRRSPGRSERHHPVLIALAVVVAVVVIGGAAFAYWVDKQVNPGGKLGAVETVVIPKDSSSSQIGHILASKGIIHSGSLFHYYVGIKGGGTLYPGTYRLAKNESYSRVIAALHAGPPIITDKLIIPEGYTIAQMATTVAKLPHAGISASQFLAAAKGGQVRSPFEPAGTKNLEGLLFPATYPVQAGQGADVLVQQMVNAFNQNAQQAGVNAAARRLHMTPYQVIIVASMVEREANRPQDLGNVASVIYNRIAQNMPLQIDSTLLYGLGTTNANVNPDTPNPYNTRIKKGLPPTPIANPGLAALEAATHPPSTTYLYYAVTGPGGQTSFASNGAGFAQIQAECQQRGYCS